MNPKKVLTAIVAGAIGCSGSAMALEVDREVMPRVTLSGRLITTLDSDYEASGDPGINMGDSSFSARFDKRMFEQGVAGAVLGVKENEGSVAFHQMHVFYWDRDVEVKAGRTQLPNTLVEFPLVRDHDITSMTHVGNGSSNEEFDQLYGKVFTADWVLDRKAQKLGVWAGTRRNENAFAGAPDGFDSYGLGYRYEPSEKYMYLNRIRHAGILLDAQKDRAGSNPYFQSIVAGGEINLNNSPRRNWSMGIQGIVNGGVSGVTLVDLNSATDAVSNRARAKSNALVASLRYTDRPHLLTRLQAGLTVGYKTYDAGGTELSVIPSLKYRIGQGVDVVAQYRNTQYSDGLNAVDSTNLVQVGLSFSLDAKYNDSIGERDSILNQEHGYIQ
ncbi:MAG: hypothetical protein AMS22_10800 [Thiotrichales bacterium SG8_50]|nr:MAG: hypothetical protein AMS22_10800 [Thiotrichales bacterium SG8_50]